MNEQEIKQYAKDCVEEAISTVGALWLSVLRKESADQLKDLLIYCIEKGAHSRDEEIKELQNKLESLRKGFYERGDKLKELMLVNNKLRNPWISVKDRLPEKLENDCASYYVLTRMDGPRQIWYMVNRYNYDIKAWEGCTNTTTHWMPIPELKKGEEECF